MKAGVTNVMNGLEEGRIDQKGLAQIALGGAIAGLSGRGMAYNFKGLLSAGDNLARSSRISETASETMASGKGSKGRTNAAEPPSAYGKGRDIETNGFGPDTIINRNANYGAKAADPSYGVSNKPIGDYQLGTNTPSRSSYVTGTSRTGMAAGAEEKIWLRAGDGTGVSGTPGRKVSGSLGSTGLDVGKPKVPDVPEIAGKGIGSDNDFSVYYKKGLKEIPKNWIEVEAPEEYKVKSQAFINFLEEQGYKPKNWRKVVEKWAAPDGTIYQRHYWTNGTDYYYHGDGIEEFNPH